MITTKKSSYHFSIDSNLTSSQVSCWIIYVCKVYVYAVVDLRKSLGPAPPLFCGKKENHRGKKSRHGKQDKPTPASTRSGSATDMQVVANVCASYF